MFFDKKSNKYAELLTKIVAAIMSVIIFCLLTGADMDDKLKRVTLVTVDAFTDKEKSRELTTRQDLVGAFLEENKIEVGEFDKVNLLLEDELCDDAEVVLRKGKMITLNIDGQMQILTATYKTVGEVFSEVGVSLGELDVVQPGLETEITDGLEVTVTRVAREEIVEDVEIPFTTKEIADNTLAKGKKVVKEKGVNGIKRTVYSVTKTDGVETERVVVSEEVVTEPVEQVVRVGTKVIQKATSTGKKSVVTNAGETLNYSKKLTVTATAYTAAPGKKTASGRVAQYGVIAVDPKVIPMGSKLYVESTDDGKSWQYGYCVAGDTGGAIKGNKIDLYFNSRNQCLQFGRKSAIVYVLE